MNGYLYFPDNLKDIKKTIIGLYDKLQNLFPINDSFQRKSKLIATPYILQ